MKRLILVLFTPADVVSASMLKMQHLTMRNRKMEDQRPEDGLLYLISRQ